MGKYSYFMEIWLRGFAKDRLRAISPLDPETYHPHVTLVRSFNLPEKTNEGEVRSLITGFCRGCHPIPFVIEGKGSFPQEGGIYYAKITEDGRLLEFDSGLERLLEGRVIFAKKLGEEKVFHATVSFDKDMPACPRIEQYMLRLTCLRDKKIWFSFDFVTQKDLSREESLDKGLWRRTVRLFSAKYGLLPTRNGFVKISGSNE